MKSKKLSLAETEDPEWQALLFISSSTLTTFVRVLLAAAAQRYLADLLQFYGAQRGGGRGVSEP